MTKETPEKEAERRNARYFGIVILVIGLAGLAIGFIRRDAIPAVGASLFGFIVGMLVGFFVQEAKEWTQSAMAASVGVLAGTGAMALLHFGAPSDPYSVWFYPIGLIVGFGFGTIWVAADPEDAPGASPKNQK